MSPAYCLHVAPNLLNPGIEGSSIGQPRERWRNHGRILAVAETAKDNVLRADQTIDSHISLVHLVLKGRITGVVVEYSGLIGRRVKVQQLDSVGVDTLHGEHVARKGLPEKTAP